MERLILRQSVLSNIQTDMSHFKEEKGDGRFVFT